VHGWTDPFDPDRTYPGPGDQWSYLRPHRPRHRPGRHAAPEPYPPAPEPYLAGPEPYPAAPEPYPRARDPYPAAPEPYLAAPEPYPAAREPYPGAFEPYDGAHRPGGDRYRPVLDDPPAESGDRERRRPSPVILAGIAAAATLIIIVGIAGLLLPVGADPTTTATSGDRMTGAAGGPGAAGGAGTPSELRTGPARPTPSAAATRASGPAPAPTRAVAPIAPPKRTTSPTPRRTESTATTATAPARSATASPAVTPAQQVVSLVNEERAAAGCGPLAVDSKLTTAAERHSEDQAAHQNMSHTGSDGSSLKDRVDRVGYEWHTLGENVAYGQTTPAQVMDDWMDSTGHRRNILNCEFEDIGVGVARDVDGRLAWTQVFGA
jgi:uncharacterized protein YkwD